MKCPICRKEVEDLKYKPFCCKRCADIDLGNWFGGNYRFVATELDEKDLKEIEKSQKTEED